MCVCVCVNWRIQRRTIEYERTLLNWIFLPVLFSSSPSSALHRHEIFVLRIDKKSESSKSKRCAYVRETEKYNHDPAWIFLVSDNDSGGREVPRLRDLCSPIVKQLTKHGCGVIVVTRVRERETRFEFVLCSLIVTKCLFNGRVIKTSLNSRRSRRMRWLVEIEISVGMIRACESACNGWCDTDIAARCRTKESERMRALSSSLFSYMSRSLVLSLSLPPSLARSLSSLRTITVCKVILSNWHEAETAGQREKERKGAFSIHLSLCCSQKNLVLSLLMYARLHFSNFFDCTKANYLPWKLELCEYLCRF